MNKQTIKEGFCQCGCGKRAPLARQNYPQQGYTKGKPVRFIMGHNNHGPLHPQWKGGKRINNGYVVIWKPEHPRANSQGCVREHILIVEKALGKPLPDEAVIHHANENRADNRNENLIVCQDKNYHELIHRRTKAFRACGHADWKQCRFCKKWDDPQNLFVNHNIYHRKCERKYQKQWRARKKNRKVTE